MNEQIIIIPYNAISLSIVGRFVFMYLLYKNKSTNNLSLLFCTLNIISSGMWIYYSVLKKDNPLIIRSCTELSLLFISSVYILRNKFVNYYNTQILPT